MLEHYLGIDVGGTGIKGAIVDVNTGELKTERLRIPTPKPATPEKIAETINKIRESLNSDLPIGICLPSVVKNHIVLSAANIDKSWINVDTFELFSKYFPKNTKFNTLNDADAALLAEANFGTLKEEKGSILMLTIGTGIGSAMISNGQIFLNTELGHMIVDNHEAEKIASGKAKDDLNEDYKTWSIGLNKVLREFEKLLNPSQIILGGGISKKPEKWLPYINISTPVLPAKLANNAGIIGSAMYIANTLKN